MQFIRKVLLTPQKKRTAAEDPATTFSKLWDGAVLSIADASAPEHVDDTDLPRRFALMADLLAAESRRSDGSTTGPCLELLFKSDMLGNLVRLSLSDEPEGIKGETIRFFASLVVLLDERFLVHSAVHRPLLKLLHECIQPDGVDGFAAISAEYEVDLVDLLSFVANRIRSFPELLPVFFHNRAARPRKPVATTLKPIGSIEQRILQTEKQTSVVRNGRLSPTPSEESTAPSSSNQGNLVRSTTPGEYEFLIFGYLLRFIHREGRIGDLARAGLLFLIDVAMSAGAHPLATAPPAHLSDATLALAEYLLDSDFANVLTAGIGALYGLLPTKLAVRVEGTSPAGGMVLGGMGEPASLDALGAQEEGLAREGIVLSTSSELRDPLSLMLKLVAFAQDVLQRVPSPVVSHELARSVSSAVSTMSSSVSLVGACLAESILVDVQNVFLESVVYPSIMESSETDSSGVAVLAYLDATLSVLDSGSPLASAILDYLCNDGHQMAAAWSVHSERRHLKRKSNAMMLVEGLGSKRQGDAPFVAEGRFTLRDLVLQHLECPLPAAKTAALRLLRTIFSRHQRSASRLLKLRALPPPSLDEESDEEEFVYPGSGAAKKPRPESVDTAALLLRHSAEMKDLLQLLIAIDPSVAMSEPTADARLLRYTQDAEMLVANGFGSSSQTYTLDRSDALMREILDGLQSFFSQSASVNLELTGVLAALAACAMLSLDGWLLPQPNTYPMTAMNADDAFADPPRHDDGDDRSIDHIIEDRHRLGLLPSRTAALPRWGSSRSAGVVMGTLEQLANTVAAARSRISGFDELLSERRNGLLFADSLAEALAEPQPGSTPQLDPPSTPRAAQTGAGSTTNPFAAHYARTAALPSPLVDGSGNLSVFLDNVVIMEEAVRELVAVIQCRRALGVDPL